MRASARHSKPFQHLSHSYVYTEGVWGEEQDVILQLPRSSAQASDRATDKLYPANGIRAVRCILCHLLCDDRCNH